MNPRLIFGFAIFMTMGIQAFGQLNPEEALAGLKKYAAAMDAIESATFYYKRTIFSPALNEKNATKCAIQMMNSLYQQFPAGNMGITAINFIDQINQQKDSLMKEYRRSYIHQIGFAKDYLSDAQFLPNGKMIFERRIDGATMTFVDQAEMTFNRRGQREARTMPLRPEQKWLTDLVEWRRVLDLIPSASASVSAKDGGQFLLQVESNSTYDDVKINEIHEVEIKKWDDYFIPAVSRVIYESMTRSNLYENYVNRNGLPIPSSIRQEEKRTSKEQFINRPHEMSYALLPEGYKLGDPVE